MCLEVRKEARDLVRRSVEQSVRLVDRKREQREKAAKTKRLVNAMTMMSRDEIEIENGHLCESKPQTKNRERWIKLQVR